MNQLVNSITTILAAVVGLAILSVILSKNSQTSSVLTSGGSAFSGILNAAESPVTGSSISGGGYGMTGGYATAALG